ncbi:cyclin-dependent kinase A-1-like isoform X3 [Vespula squamosa]|uniref:cyclin-dependent kinase n=1 Tax=Vespula squamosa TaxID=30214 RepID=A0ABD2AWS0_VESSQ
MSTTHNDQNHVWWTLLDGYYQYHHYHQYYYIPEQSRNVVMAGRSRRPSSELGPDLSSPHSKKLKLSELPQEVASYVTVDEGDSVEKELESSERITSTPNEEEIINVIDSPKEEAIVHISESPKDFEEEILVVDSPKDVEVDVINFSGTPKEEEEINLSEVTVSATESPVEEVIPGPSWKSHGVIPKSDEKHILQGTSLIDMKTTELDSSGDIHTSLMGEHASYDELSYIGNGAYGTVYKAKDLTSGQVVALKRVRVPLTEDGLPTSTLREIATLKQLERFEHPHIVRLLDVCQGNYHRLPSSDERSDRLNQGLTLWLVFEHVEQDLASYLSTCPEEGMAAHIVKQMSKEILRGVEFLHSHRIIHRDLKPQNLLVTREGRIKIADFGLARTYDFEMRLTSVVVTQWYRAPEVLLGCSYATPVDTWSVGCILAELSMLKPLFPGTSEGDQLDRIFRIIGTPSEVEWPKNVSLSWSAFPDRQPKPLSDVIPNLDDDGLDLIQSLLMFDPHVRLTATQALEHKYFNENDT